MSNITYPLDTRKVVGKKSDVVFASMMVGVSLGGIFGAGAFAFGGAILGAIFGIALIIK